MQTKNDTFLVIMPKIDEKETKKIIDLLKHRIYLWQDKILIEFNQSNLCDNEISVDDTDVNTIIKTLSEPNASSSDSVEYGTPDQSRTGD